MTVFSLDPLQDRRWQPFVEEHPRASIFHTAGWLEAIRKTYGYEPTVFTTTPPDRELTSGLVVCRVNSWLTGRRLTSIPFADHCELLAEGCEEHRDLLEHAVNVVRRERLGYLEIRLPASASCADLAFGTAQTFAFHTLDLRPSLSEVFSRLHKDGIQRKIRRADRDGLEYEAGQSDQLLRQFFGLLTITRRRHRVPPQPFVWFQHLRDCLGDRLRIHVALKNKQAVAAIVTLRHRNTLYYKYGGSDVEHHQSGAMPFLLWKAIHDAKNAGLQTLDLGRSDLENAGLITFKQRLGTTPGTLTYLRYPVPSPSRIQLNSAMRFARELVPLLPHPLLIAAGKLLYRHVG
jgi:hypothetical protein